MTTTRAAFAVAAILGLTVASRASAHEMDHIDQLAGRLQGQIKKLASEFRTHYTHTPEYRHLRKDTSKMYQLARHIHSVAHYEGDIEHIHDDMEQLDDLFHHIEDVVGELEHEASHGHGHVHGHTGHVHEYMEAVEDTLHHLMEDVEEIVHGHGHGDGDEGFGPDAGGPPSGGIGVEFGGGQFRIRVGD